MTPVTLTIEHSAPRWIHRIRRGRFVLQVPANWEEVRPESRRRRWWRWNMVLPRQSAQLAMVRDLLRDVPRRARRMLHPLDEAGLTLLLDWAKAEPDCDAVPIPHITHGGTMYVFPAPKGKNVTCLEFALCDDLYKQVIDGDDSALATLSAVLWRERDKDEQAALRRSDARVLLHSSMEAESRAARLKKAPAEMQHQALLYFEGLKLYVHRMYGKWLFEQEDDDDEEEESDTTGQRAPETSSGPNFGWWGVFMQVAESGVFGDLKQVYQTSLHDICIYMVKKRAEAEQASSSMAAAANLNHTHDEA